MNFYKKLLIIFLFLLTSCYYEKENITQIQTEVNLLSFEDVDLEKMKEIKPLDLQIEYYSRNKKTDSKRLQELKKLMSLSELRTLDIQDLNNYQDKDYTIFEELSTENLESISITFSNIDEKQWLEKTLLILKEKINSSLNLANFRYLSLYIWNYRFSEEELQILTEIRIKHFWYNDDESLVKNIDDTQNLTYSESDNIIKVLLRDSPYLEKVLYWDYRWFIKKYWKIIYDEDYSF